MNYTTTSSRYALRVVVIYFIEEKDKVKLSGSKEVSIVSIEEAKEESEYLISSDEDALLGGLALHGPRKAGKSHTAATISEFFPEVLGEKLVELSDVAWISFDAGATAFAGPWKLRIPHVVNVIKAIADSDPLMGALKAVDIVSKLDVEYVVVDTVSMFDKYLNGWASTKVNDDKGWEIYRHMLNAHKKFYVELVETGKKAIFLCHSKALSEVQGNSDAAKNQKNTRKASYAVMPDIVPDITGQGATVYLGNCNAQIVVKTKVDPGTKEKTRYLALGSVDGFEAGSRWEGVFKQKDILEPNLRKMLAQVSATGNR